MEGLISETFILVLMVNGTKSHEKNVMSWEILIKSIIAHVVMMLVLINMVLNVKHRLDFGNIMGGLIL